MAQAKENMTKEELTKQLEAKQQEALELANKEIAAICEAYGVELVAVAGIQDGRIVAQPVLRQKVK